MSSEPGPDLAAPRPPTSARPVRTLDADKGATAYRGTARLSRPSAICILGSALLAGRRVAAAAPRSLQRSDAARRARSRAALIAISGVWRARRAAGRRAFSNYAVRKLARF